MSETRYLSCAETATLLRLALKEAFPKVKFSVRSKTYSGGASIDVRWTDGPREARVKAVSDRFEGATFDGMEDLKSYRTTELVQPDGSREKVHHGADFIFVSRAISNAPERIAAAARLIRERCRLEEGERFGGRDLSELARRLAHDHDADEDMEPAFRRVVLMESTE